MSRALITLSYRYLINSDSKGYIAEGIHKASWEEFLLKSQNYNKDGALFSFSQMKEKDGRANSLHYKTGFAADGYIALLNKHIPGIVTTQEDPLLFETYRFELLSSDIRDRNAHSVAIHFISPKLTLLQSFGERLLLAYGDRSTGLNDHASIEDTFMVSLQPSLSVIQYQPVAVNVSNIW